LLPNGLYLRSANFSVAADQWNPERQRSGGDDSVGQIRYFGSLHELQGFRYEAVERDERTWTRARLPNVGVQDRFGLRGPGGLRMERESRGARPEKKRDFVRRPPDSAMLLFSY